MHPPGLLEAARQDADLDARLERQIKSRRQRTQKRLAPAPVGPDECVAWLVFLEETVAQILERRAVPLDDRLTRDGQLKLHAQPRVQSVGPAWKLVEHMMLPAGEAFFGLVGLV